MTKRTYPTPTADQIAALEAFKAYHQSLSPKTLKSRNLPKGWKETLSMIYWPRAILWYGPLGNNPNVGSTLHTVRNNFGPSWLFSTSCPVA